MIYFTSDWNLGEIRLGGAHPNVLFRPFTSTLENDFTIVNNFINSGFEDGDTLYFLGNVFYEVTELNTQLIKSIEAKFPNSKFILVLGKYDTADKAQAISKLFTDLWHDMELKQNGCVYYLNHLPTFVADFLNDYPEFLGITGSVHGSWRIKGKTINVGVDAWHFKPVSLEQLEYCFS